MRTPFFHSTGVIITNYYLKDTIKSLNYVLYSSFRKIFRTNSHDVVKDCMIVFIVQLQKKQSTRENVNF